MLNRYICTLLILNTNASVLTYFQSRVKNYHTTNYFNFRQKLKLVKDTTV